MIKRILVIALAISTTLNAQNEVDALRYSTHDNLGTARYSAMGGAFGSLGGEFSALSLNPAGIGMYQFSEFTFTPTFNLNSTKSYFNGTNTADYNTGLDIGNLGLVFTIPKGDTDWKRINIAIGWNQLASYNRSVRIEGDNSGLTFTDNIVDATNGFSMNDLSEGNAYSESVMAWNTYLIDPLFNGDSVVDGQYISNFSNGTKNQFKTINSRGSLNEFVFSVGSSFQEKLYLGATLGIPTLDYTEIANYTEKETSDTTSNLRQLDYSEEFTAYGHGYNLKLGAIYRVSETFKVGGAIHTPTVYTIEEDYYTDMITHFKDSTLDQSMGYEMPFQYNLTTPWKAIVSASTIFNNNILISADYEILDYTKGKLYPDYEFEYGNKAISKIYQNTENIKIGAEMNIKPFILRAGYAKLGSAFANKDFSRENFSYGLGINNGGYYFDIAYVLSQGANEHLLYNEEYIAPTSLVNTNHSLIFTIGFRY